MQLSQIWRARREIIEQREPADPRSKRSASVAAKPTFDSEQSAKLRDALIAELKRIGSPDDAAVWARRNLAAKNKLTAADATAVESAFAERLSELDQPPTDINPANDDAAAAGRPEPAAASQTAPPLLAPRGGRSCRKASACAIKNTGNSSQASPVLCAGAPRATRTICASLSPAHSVGRSATSSPCRSVGRTTVSFTGGATRRLGGRRSKSTPSPWLLNFGKRGNSIELTYKALRSLLVFGGMSGNQTMTSAQSSPGDQSRTLNQKPAPEEPKRSWWHSLLERLWR